MHFLQELESRFARHLKLAATSQAKLPDLEHVPDVLTRKRLLCSDQIAMAVLFSPLINCFNLRYAILPEHWNWRGGNPYRVCAEEVVIDHHPRLRENSFHQLADVAYRHLTSGDFARSARYYETAIEALDPELTSLTAGEVIQQLASASLSWEMLESNTRRDMLASLLSVALFHQRCLKQPEESASIEASVSRLVSS
jgi:hypothetical protein